MNALRIGTWCLAALLTACGGGGGDDTTDTSTAPVDSTTPGPATPVATDPIAASIQAFRIDSKLELTVGGGVTYKAYPVALFKDGRALLETSALIDPDGLDAHRAKKPAAWSTWRQTGANVEFQQPDGSWKTFTDPTVLKILPAGFLLNAPYQTLTVVSGPLSFSTSEKYTFTRGGKVARDLLAIGEAPNFSFVGASPDNPGTYTIKDGFRLNISLQDGKKEEHVIVADPDKPKYIYIDGMLYWIPD